MPPNEWVRVSRAAMRGGTAFFILVKVLFAYNTEDEKNSFNTVAA